MTAKQSVSKLAGLYPSAWGYQDWPEPGQECPSCGKGVIHQRVAARMCNWCGKIRYSTDSEIFEELEPGAQFYQVSASPSDNPQLYTKVEPVEWWGENAVNVIGRNGEKSSFGAWAAVIRAERVEDTWSKEPAAESGQVESLDDYQEKIEKLRDEANKIEAELDRLSAEVVAKFAPVKPGWIIENSFLRILVKRVRFHYDYWTAEGPVLTKANTVNKRYTGHQRISVLSGGLRSSVRIIKSE